MYNSNYNSIFKLINELVNVNEKRILLDVKVAFLFQQILIILFISNSFSVNR